MNLGKTLQSVKRKGFALGMGALLLSTGCLKTPNIEYVTNKENQGNYTFVENDSSSGSIAEQIGAPSHVEQEGKTLNQNTFITIDADVLISAEQTVPVYAITPLPITEEMLKFYVGRIYDGETYRYPYYNPMFEAAPHTQEEIQKKIEYYQEHLNQMNVVDVTDVVGVGEGVEGEEVFFIDGNGFIRDAGGNMVVGVYDQESYDLVQNQIIALQQELLTTPEEQELLSEVTYDWEPHTIQTKDFNDFGFSMVYTDYNYDVASFVGQRQGHRFHLTFTKDNFCSTFTLSMDKNEKLENGYLYGDPFVKSEVDWVENNSIDNQCKYTKEEAEDLCRDFLKDLELRDMDVQVVKQIQLQANGQNLGFQGYRLYCYRSYNGMGDTMYKGYDSKSDLGDDRFMFDSGAIHGYHLSTNTLEERIGTNREIAIFTVLDDGIVEAKILNPMENQELLAENTKLMNFDTVLNQGLTQLSVQYGDSGDTFHRRMIQVNTIELNYACMKSPDEDQKYTMVPVWDFKSGRTGVVYVSINAVDGTVFDRGLGH